MPLFFTLSNFETLQKPIFFKETVILTVENALKLTHWQKKRQKIFLPERSQTANTSSNYLSVILSSPKTLHLSKL